MTLATMKINRPFQGIFKFVVLVAFELQRPRLRTFFEKLEEKQKKTRKEKKTTSKGNRTPDYCAEGRSPNH